MNADELTKAIVEIQGHKSRIANRMYSPHTPPETKTALRYEHKRLSIAEDELWAEAEELYDELKEEVEKLKYLLGCD